MFRSKLVYDLRDCYELLYYKWMCYNCKSP